MIRKYHQRDNFMVHKHSHLHVLTIKFNSILLNRHPSKLKILDGLRQCVRTEELSGYLVLKFKLSLQKK